MLCRGRIAHTWFLQGPLPQRIAGPDNALAIEDESNRAGHPNTHHDMHRDDLPIEPSVIFFSPIVKLANRNNAMARVLEMMTPNFAGVPHKQLHCPNSRGRAHTARSQSLLLLARTVAN